MSIKHAESNRKIRCQILRLICSVNIKLGLKKKKKKKALTRISSNVKVLLWHKISIKAEITRLIILQCNRAGRACLGELAWETQQGADPAGQHRGGPSFLETGCTGCEATGRQAVGLLTSSLIAAGQWLYQRPFSASILI